MNLNRCDEPRNRCFKVKIHTRLDFMPAFQKIKGRLSSPQSLCLDLYGVTDTTYDLFWIAPQPVTTC